MSKMQLRMEAESGSPQELPTLQDAAGCSSEGVDYKLCKRGHVKSPDNVLKDGRCRQCKIDYNNSDAYKKSAKKHRETEKYKMGSRDRSKRFRQSEKGKLYCYSYAKSDKHKESMKKYKQTEKGKLSILRFNKTEGRKKASKKYQVKSCSMLSAAYIRQKLRIPAECAYYGLIELKRMMIKLTRAKRAYLKGERHEQA